VRPIARPSAGTSRRMESLNARRSRVRCAALRCAPRSLWPSLCQGAHIVRVAGQQSSWAGQGVCGDRDDGIDRVASVGSAEQLSGGPAEVRTERMLLHGGRESLDRAAVPRKDLGEGCTADVYAGTHLLGNRKLGSYTRGSPSAPALSAPASSTTAVGMTAGFSRDAAEPFAAHLSRNLLGNRPVLRILASEPALKHGAPRRVRSAFWD
jgi:hypothetical protein